MNNGFKYLLIILFFQLVQINIYSQGTWERIESPTDQYLQSVYFVDSLYGWAVGDSGTIIHTSNGGADWEIQDSKNDNKIVDVFFLNRNLGWASSWKTSSVPFGTILLKTTNGGQSWTNEPYKEDNIFIQCLLFTDSLNGWMGGKPHALVKTTDGGANWKQADVDSSTFSSFPIKSINFYNSQYGYACGGIFEYAGVMWRTTNGGDFWYVIDPVSAPIDPIWQVHTFDSLNVLGVGGDFEFFGVGMIRTSDGGLNWVYEYIGMTGIAFDIDYRTDYEAWSPLGFEEKLIYSLDSGFTWTRIPTPDSTIILDMIFPDSLHGFAIGKEGAIIKYIPPIINFVKEIEEGIPESFFLFQNYPNPFNPSTKIRFTIPQDERRETQDVSLKVYDVLGNEIATLVNEEKPAGAYEVKFNPASGIQHPASGIYFYQLRAGIYIETKKMLLLK
jgi:photosystem II stability/assembly factor-like uncharacterized protein